MSIVPAASQTTVIFNISLSHNLANYFFKYGSSIQYTIVSYSTKVSQNEGIITLFSPRVFSDNVFDGYDELVVLYSHLAMDKKHTVR